MQSPLDLRTRPFYTVRALRRLSALPAPVACLEAPVEPQLTPTAAVPAQTPVIERVQGAAVPNAARGAAAAGTPSAPVRVTAAVTPPPTPPPVSTTSPASGPVRMPTAPVKNGRAYDWTGLP